MKELRITFDDAVYSKLKQQKGSLSWREYIIELYNYRSKGVQVPTLVQIPFGADTLE